MSKRPTAGPQARGGSGTAQGGRGQRREGGRVGGRGGAVAIKSSGTGAPCIPSDQGRQKSERRPRG